MRSFASEEAGPQASTRNDVATDTEPGLARDPGVGECEDKYYPRWMLDGDLPFFLLYDFRTYSTKLPSQVLESLKWVGDNSRKKRGKIEKYANKWFTSKYAHGWRKFRQKLYTFAEWLIRLDGWRIYFTQSLINLLKAHVTVSKRNVWKLFFLLSGKVWVPKRSGVKN